MRASDRGIGLLSLEAVERLTRLEKTLRLAALLCVDVARSPCEYGLLGR